MINSVTSSPYLAPKFASSSVAHVMQHSAWQASLGKPVVWESNVDFAYHLGYDYVIGQMVRVVGTINDYTPEELAKIAVLTEIFRDSGGTNPLFIGKAKFFPGHRRHQTEWAYRRPTFENEKVFKTLDEAIWDALHLETAERQKLFTAS